MDRSLVALAATMLCFAGCCTAPSPVRFVPTTSLVRVEPQPITLADFRGAEREGNSIVATGRGLAFGMSDEPVPLNRGERLHVLGISRDSLRIVVRRLDERTLASVDRDAVEVVTTTYPRSHLVP